MRFLTLYIIVFISFTSLRAQKEYNRWYFGTKAGIDFNTSIPTALTDGKMDVLEGCGSISTRNGRLLFYTDGETIWDSTHSVMPNGKLNLNSVTPTQSGHIVQNPDSSHLFTVFSLVVINSTDCKVYYSEINMKLNNGKGDVISNTKNRLLMKNTTEKITFTRHANGKDYWILIPILNSDTIYAFLLNSLGIQSNPVKNKSGFLIPILTNINTIGGQLKVSPDGKKIAFSNTFLNKSSICDFNNTTGTINNGWSFTCYTGYGLEFSKNSKYLYAGEVVNRKDDDKLFQYDAKAASLSAFNASKTLVDSNYFTYISVKPSLPIGALQLGPDGKIYISTYGCKYLHVIHAPDSFGLASRPQKNYLYLAGGISRYGLPSYLNTHQIKRSFDYSNVCAGDSTRFKLVTIGTYDSSIWDFGDPLSGIENIKKDNVQACHLYKKTGTYLVRLISFSQSQKDTFSVSIKIGPKFKVFIGNDTAFCHQFSHIIKASPGFKTYNWNTGSTAMQITVNSKGIYSVKVLDSNTCPSGDTIAIDQIQKPVIKLSYDSVNCQYVYLSTDSLKGLTYLWSNGETKKDIKVSQKGWISLTASHPFCSNKDSVYVNQLPTPEVDLGIDTSLCANELVLKTKEQGRYLWSTMENRPSIVINQPGKYWLTVTRNNCSATDTINVKLCEDMLYYIPDVFSPNGDNINEVFRIYGSNIANVEMEIFNRWGELLLKTSGKDVAWDGTYKNELCMESVYFYKATIKGRKPGSIKNLKGSVTLLK